MQLPLMTTLRWMRAPGDTVFAIGIIAAVAFIFGIGRRAASRALVVDGVSGERLPRRDRAGRVNEGLVRPRLALDVALPRTKPRRR